jgi:hypothetical protein
MRQRSRAHSELGIGYEHPFQRNHRIVTPHVGMERLTMPRYLIEVTDNHPEAYMMLSGFSVGLRIDFKSLYDRRSEESLPMFLRRNLDFFLQPSSSNVFLKVVRFAKLCFPEPGIANWISSIPPASHAIACLAVLDAITGSPPKAPHPHAPNMSRSIP